MSKPVEIADLGRHLAHYGALATVVTVTDQQRAHIGTSLVAVDGDRLRITVGPRTAGHLGRNPDLCLTWVPPAGDDYQLIVDGTALDVRPNGDVFDVVLTIASGIRHRVAGAPPDGPTCVLLEH